MTISRPFSLSFIARLTLLRLYWANQLIYSHFSSAGLVLQVVNQYLCTSFPQNRQQPFLNLQTGENDFMINLHKRYVAELGFKLANPGSAVRHTTDFNMKPNSWPITSCLINSVASNEIVQICWTICIFDLAHAKTYFCMACSMNCIYSISDITIYISIGQPNRTVPLIFWLYV